MSENKINQSGDGLDFELLEDKIEMTSGVEKAGDEALLEKEATADLASDKEANITSSEEVDSVNEQEENESTLANSMDDNSDGVALDGSNDLIAEEYQLMDNVINGKKRHPKKRKRPMSKQGKIAVYTAIACVCIAFLSVVAYFGSMFLGTKPPTQGIGGADLIVDMTDCDFYVGTSGKIDLAKTFPNGKEFKADGGAKIRGTELTIDSNSTEDFNLTFNDVVVVDGKENTTQVTKVCKVMVNENVGDGSGSVNVSTWAEFRKAASENKIIVLQDDIACPPLANEKRAKHGVVTIRNDVYGNGHSINLFELTVSRNKAGSKIYGTPYLKGNGKVWGDTGLAIRCKEDNSQLIFQDVHVTGCDMSLEAAVYEGDENKPEEGDGTETPKPTADEETEERVVIKPAGNLYGLTQADVDKRGVLLFSKNGNLVDISGENGEKANVVMKHCVLENGAKVLHIVNTNMDLIGTVVRNAADTAISIQTSANNASYIKSYNNVIANSLTGGILFYCFDATINESNAEDTWNTFEIMPDTFLDIYNWKNQNGLAFLPETEGFANIANPIAGSEIPQAKYDKLKGNVNGQMYIHFAIIKIRTGDGLPKNSSKVVGYENIGYTTAKENGFEKGFPIPGIASAIMKEIDVWGYYGNIEGSVSPTTVLGGETDEDLALFYKELRDGRQPKTDDKK